jgi:hypothetical protein
MRVMGWAGGLQFAVPKYIHTVRSVHQTELTTSRWRLVLLRAAVFPWPAGQPARSDLNSASLFVVSICAQQQLVLNQGVTQPANTAARIQ